MTYRTWQEANAFSDAVKGALVDLFSVSADTAEAWLLDYIETAPACEVRPATTVAHEIFMERVDVANVPNLPRNER